MLSGSSRVVKEFGAMQGADTGPSVLKTLPNREDTLRDFMNNKQSSLGVTGIKEYEIEPCVKYRRISKSQISMNHQLFEHLILLEQGTLPRGLRV